MDNENGLQQLTVRLPLNVKEKIENLAKNGGCSTAESRAVMPDIPQRGVSVEAAAWPPMNETPEMRCVPARKPVDIKRMKDTINAVISGPRREDRAETPIPAQPAPTTPPTAAEGGGGAR